MTRIICKNLKNHYQKAIRTEIRSNFPFIPARLQVLVECECGNRWWE